MPLLVCALTVAWAPASHAAPPDFVGMTSEDVFAGEGHYRSSTMNHQRSVGVGLIRQVFDWYNANGGPNLPLNGSPVIPGVSPIIGDLSSPNVWEYATGINRQFGAQAAVRADFVYRDYGNFYADFTTPGVTARDNEGRVYDLVTIGNDDGLAVRKYAGLSLQGTYRRGSFDVGGNYTVSRNWGNFEGESVANGPIRFVGNLYPEYKREEWSYPEGDLSSDQRHRSRVWLNHACVGRRPPSSTDANCRRM